VRGGNGDRKKTTTRKYFLTFFFTISISRPGVATIASTPPFLSSLESSYVDVAAEVAPPVKLTALPPRHFRNLFISTKVCFDSSRVGDKIRTIGPSPFSTMRWLVAWITAGQTNDKVLPDPVGAVQRRSCPASARGMLYLCMSVKCVYPRAEIFSERASGKSRREVAAEIKEFGGIGGGGEILDFEKVRVTLGFGGRGNCVCFDRRW